MPELRTIHLTGPDLRRLERLIASLRDSREDLRNLSAELQIARVVAPSEVPPDVITMNSRFRLRDELTDEEMIYTLVFPDQANADEGRISVLAPIGTAALGQRVGDVVEWDVPAGRVRLRVEEVYYQPEASGHYHL